MIPISTIHSIVFTPFRQENTLQILCFTKGMLIQRKPRFTGRVEYFFKRTDMWRPRRIFWEEQGKWKAYPPKNTLQELLKVRYVFLSTNLAQNEKDGIRQFCKAFNINVNLEERTLCPFCLLGMRFTLLKPNGNYSAFGREICKACAIQELEKELIAKKVAILDSPGFKKYAISLLDRFHDIQPVMDTLTKGKASLNELTLIKHTEKGEDLETSPSIDLLPINQYLKDSIKKRGITSLLPIQLKALKNGLLENQDLLVIANTSAGKTLIAEITGFQHVLNKKKFILTVPLVALANTKYDDFVKIYGNKFNVGLRTGRSRIFSSVKEQRLFYNKRFSIKDSEVIIATYEGLDLLIRAGQLNFDDIGCVVFDEIQSLADPERGPTLDCLQAKIRYCSKNVQILGLSATVGNPDDFADKLSLKLIKTKHRPTPLEQHLLISRSSLEKLRQISSLIRLELQITSSYGFKGQTIVFTNSRRKTSEIAEYLRQAGLPSAQAYHSGLSYLQRRQIEGDFSSGKCSTIVATYALGAGVDFPASQVIFESMLMGNKILEPNTFTQMVGRAGRLGKHDRGRVVFLCLGEAISSLDSTSEIEIALGLINSPVTAIEPNYDENSCAEQIISICSTKGIVLPTNARRIYRNMIGSGNFNFMHVANKLIQESLLVVNKGKKQRELMVTQLGRASTLSFFSPQKTIAVNKLLLKNKHFLSISLEMNRLQNIYLSKKLHTYLEKTYHMKFSTRLEGPVLDVMNASLKGKESTELNKWCLSIFAKWTQNFFTCSCKENPFCSHGSEQIGRLLINERLDGKNVIQLSRILARFELLVYPGDILSFLNGIIHELEGVQRIASAIGMNKIEKNISLLISRIEVPKKKA